MTFKFFLAFIFLLPTYAFSEEFIPYGFQCQSFAPGESFSWVNDKTQFFVWASSEENGFRGEMKISQFIKGKIVSTEDFQLDAKALNDEVEVANNLPIKSIQMMINEYRFTLVVLDPQRPQSSVNWKVKATAQVFNKKTLEKYNLSCEVSL